jgi:hypothetical protein
MFKTTIVKIYILILLFSIFSITSASVDNISQKQRALIESTLFDLEKKLTNWKTQIDQYYSERFFKIEGQAEDIKKVLLLLQKGSYKGSVYKIVQSWRLTIEKLHINIVGCPPENPFSGLDLLNEADLAADSDLYQRNKKFYDDYLSFTRTIDQKQELYSRAYFEVLSLLNKCRALLLNQPEGSDYRLYYSLKQVIADIYREILILPMIFQISWQNKVTEVRNILQMGGPQGYYSIISELLIWVLFGAFIVFLSRRFSVLQEKVETILDGIIDKLGSSYKVSKIIVFILEVFSRSATWVSLIFTSIFLKELLKRSYFLELELPLTAIEIYSYYKIIYVALRYSVVKLKTSAIITLSYPKQLRLLRDLSQFLKVTFIAALGLNIINFITSKSILFQVSSWVAIALILGQVTYTLNKWKVDLYKHISNESPSILLVGGVRKALRTPFFSILVVPFIAIFLLLQEIFLYSYNQLQRFDWVKKISANILIFKARHYAIGEEQIKERPAPELYVNQVLSRGNIPIDMFVEREVYYEAITYISNALTNQDETMVNTLVIEGYKGSGKTTILHKLAEHFEESTSIVVLDMDEMYKTNPNGENINSLLQGLDPERKHIVFIDNLHKCFLLETHRKKLLQNIIDLSLALQKTLFVCLAVQRTSWQHVNNTMNIEKYFSKVLSLPTFQYNELKLLIEKRHKRTRYKVSFAEIALKDEKLSTITDHEIKALDKLVKIIWQKSGKNPLLALNIWCSCLSLDAGILSAHYPKELTPYSYKDLDVDSLFVLSTLMRYHSMNIKEISYALADSYSEYQLIIMLGLLVSKKIISKDLDGCYFINLVNYWGLLKYLEVNGYVT